MVQGQIKKEKYLFKLFLSKQSYWKLQDLQSYLWENKITVKEILLKVGMNF